jgi:hypothetical protein
MHLLGTEDALMESAALSQTIRGSRKQQSSCELKSQPDQVAVPNSDILGPDIFFPADRNGHLNCFDYYFNLSPISMHRRCFRFRPGSFRSACHPASDEVDLVERQLLVCVVFSRESAQVYSLGLQPRKRIPSCR